MKFMLVHTKPLKGDIVTYDEDDHKITYVMGDTKDEQATIYGIELSESHDDIVIMERRVPFDRIRLAKESTYNQIGYLMKLRNLVINDKYFFSFPYPKNNGDQTDPH